MTIDTSREAVEQINEELSWDNSFGAIELINALLAERDAALAEVARLSTPPDDAEVLAIIKDVTFEAVNGEIDRVLAGLICKKLARLSHARAAVTAKREAMEEALRFYADENRFGLPSDGPWGAGSTDFGRLARATLAKHGSK